MCTGLLSDHPRHDRLFVAAIIGVMVVVGSSDALAQRAGCSVTTYTDPPREVLRCADGLTITAESGRQYRLEDRNRDGTPEGAELTGRGLLIEVPRRLRSGFQVRTPHAIASVCGTVWAADVTPTRTSVFVREGIVQVARTDSPAAVTLRAGDGVDVDVSRGDLAVRRWSAERAALLLGRFGR